MVVFDDHVANMGDWMPPSPSPRTLFSSMTSGSIAESGNENINRSFEAKGMFGNSDEKNQNGTRDEGNGVSVSNAMTEPRTSARGGGLMERRAGFNAPKLNTDNMSNSEVGSPAFVIPPGLSPTSFLLESPVFLSNSLVLPSPTTGKFLFASSGYNGSSALMTHDPVKRKESPCANGNDSSFAFKPVAESIPFPYFDSVNKVNTSGFAQQSFSSVGFSVSSNTAVLNQSVEPHSQSQSNGSIFQTRYSESHIDIDRTTSLSSDHSPPLDEPNEDEGDQRSGGDPVIGNAPSEDGYNWRKYGQKQVKGSEYPRSYYKCTSLNCPVKKKVERSQEGQVTEIIYKGAHNHQKPPPNRRSAIGSSTGLGETQLDSEQPGTDANSGRAWFNVQTGNEESNKGLSGVKYELGDGVEGSSAFSIDGEDDDRATRGSASLGYDGEGDESESKRRKIESYASELTGASRAIREPRVVVQTTSEVDILDDGYRWRKYGQKVVKGNPNPRSYYKCTSTGCNVRKHVERACHDLKSVITTYEGKHNHDVPAARNSNHLNSGGPAFPPQQPTPASSNLMHMPELSQTRAHFERSQLGSYGFQGRPQMGPGPGFGYGINQPGLAGLGMARLGPNQGKLQGMGANQYLGHQSHQAQERSDMGFMVPKDEPKSEPVMDSGSNPPSNQALLYQQYMSRLPLGPQM